MKFGFALGGLILGLSVSNAMATPVRIFVVPMDGGRQETARCAKALVESTNMITDEPVDARVMSYEEHEALVKQEEGGWQNKKSRSLVVELDQRQDELALHGIPFAFTDAAHYMAYLQSPLPARLDANRDYLDETILAYGGFSQLFSRIAAVTTPKHFYNRRISGDAQGLLVYHEFGGEMGVALPGMMTADLPEAFRRMKSGHVLYDIVEAPLVGAYDAGAADVARFLSLTSTSVISIAFKLERRDTPFRSDKLSAWQRAAAMKCSKENFAAELEVLNKFKEAGVQIAPFDRASLVETSRRLWMAGKHSDWTIADFDELVSLAAPVGKSPSQIVASLPAKAKAIALRFDGEARKEHAGPHEGREPRGAAIDAILKQYRDRYSAEVQALPLPSPPSGKADRPKVLWKWWSNYDEIVKLASTLEEAIRNCAKCDTDSVLIAQQILARVDFVLGRNAAATAALDPVFAAPKRNVFRDMALLRTASSVGDVRAKAPIEDLCGKVLATASSNVKYHDFPFAELVRCVYLFSNIDDDSRARDAVKIAASYADVYGIVDRFAELANAQWYVGDMEGARQSLKKSLGMKFQRSPPYLHWPLLDLEGPETIEANRPFINIVENYSLNASDALYPVLAGSPQRKRGRYEEWAEYIGDALNVESEYGMKERKSGNLQKICGVAKGLQGEERETVDGKCNSYSITTGYLDDPAMNSKNPEERLYAVGLAVANAAHFAASFR